MCVCVFVCVCVCVCVCCAALALTLTPKPQTSKCQHGEVIFSAPHTYSKAKMTGRDVSYKNPGKLYDGKVLECDFV